ARLIRRALLIKRVEVRYVIDRGEGSLARAAEDAQVLGRQVAGPQVRTGLQDLAHWLILRIIFLPVRVVSCGHSGGEFRCRVGCSNGAGLSEGGQNAVTQEEAEKDSGAQTKKGRSQ